jgi:hypothetical protein
MHSSGDTPVRSHPLIAVAAVARRRSSLRQIGLELFFVGPDVIAQRTSPAFHYASSDLGVLATGRTIGRRAAEMGSKHTLVY